MNEKTCVALQFDTIKKEIAQYTLTHEGTEKVMKLSPSKSVKQIEAWLAEVEEAAKILRKSASVPIHGLDGITHIIDHFNKGIALRVDQFSKLFSFLDSCRKIKQFMKDKEIFAPTVSSYVYSIEELPQLGEEIQRCIRHGQVDDYASKELLKVRKQIQIEEERLKDKVQHIVQSKKYTPYLQEAIIGQRNGRYVIPIKKEYRRKVTGTVIDMSASGSTLYMEPEEVALIQEKVSSLRFEEEHEIEKVLSYLTGLVEVNQHEIKIAVETMVHYDFLFAKAKYCEVIKGKNISINESHRITLNNARHPLLKEAAVPITMELGDPNHALIITGPNTGGKTVTIKTVGLLTLMAQSGILIPVDEGSEIAVYHDIFVDIGDGQSIEQNLSTFSSRIVNIIEILKGANDRSLVLIDELGSGTDPSEGMGLATAIINEIYKKGSTLITTTHFSEMKGFALSREGFLNGSMEFDLNTLKPTYRLILGEGGESQAFAIALKLGMHPTIIKNAHYITYKEEKTYEIADLTVEAKRALDKQIATNKFVKRDRTEKEKIVKDITLFTMGDNVQVTQTGEYGIIYKGPNEKGNYIVQIKGEKQEINHKRLKLYIAADELYPSDYDFDIIFESKDNRKKRHDMERKHIDGLMIELE